MGLITGSIAVIIAVVTSPLWIPILLTAIVAPHFVFIPLGIGALLTSPIWIPLALIGIPVLFITHPIWLPLLLLIIIL